MYNEAYNEAKNILQYKKDYDEYSKQGNAELANAAAQRAKKSYEFLNGNGYGEVAEYFKNNGYSNSKNYFDGYFSVQPGKYDEKEVRNKIVNLKNLWQNADEAGDREAAEGYAAKAQGYYSQMYANGDDIAASNLQNRNYKQASEYVKSYYNTLGKTAMRPYLYTKGADYGLSQADVDKAISYNSDTGEISLGGKNLGKADAYTDGTSYWDSDKLDAAWNDYVSNAGLTKNTDAMSKQMWQRYNDDYITLRDKIANENPYTNDVGKSILAKYDLSAFNAGNNAAASGAASNGGNIDSFSAANAMRNQAAMITQGQQAALDAHNSRIDRFDKLLDEYAKNADVVFNEGETAKLNNDTLKNNEVARDISIMDTTGKVMDKYTYEDNPFLNDDGSLRNENLNFKEIMENARERLKTETDTAEVDRLNSLINYASQAREIKLDKKYNFDGRYSQWDDGDYIYSRPDTYKVWEGKRQSSDLDRTLASNEKMNSDNNAAQQQINSATLASNERINSATLASNERRDAANNSSAEKIAILSNGKSSSEGEDATSQDAAKAAAKINSLYSGAVKINSTGDGYVVQDKYKQAAWDTILAMGYTPQQCIQIALQIGFSESDIQKYGG